MLRCFLGLSHPVTVRYGRRLRPHGHTLQSESPGNPTSMPSCRPLSSSALLPRPFRVLGLQQVAIGALDKSGPCRLWGDVLGVPMTGTYKSEKENVDEDIFRVGAPDCPWAVEIDLMQPIDPAKAPKVHVPALNHIGLWVHPLTAAVEYLSKQGVRFTPGGIRRGAAGHDVCFIHPKGNEKSPLSGEGVLIELVQAPPEVVRAYESAVETADLARSKG